MVAAVFEVLLLEVADSCRRWLRQRARDPALLAEKLPYAAQLGSREVFGEF